MRLLHAQMIPEKKMAARDKHVIGQVRKQPGRRVCARQANCNGERATFVGAGVITNDRNWIKERPRRLLDLQKIISARQPGALPIYEWHCDRVLKVVRCFEKSEVGVREV